MGWKTFFEQWKEAGKTQEWLTSRLNLLLNTGKINQSEYDEIFAIINPFIEGGE